MNASYITEYYEGIQNGTYNVGKWIKLVYNYIIECLNDAIVVYDDVIAEKAIDWIENHCFHVEGPLAPGPFKLELWQKAMIAAMFGLRDPETGNRQFREIVLVIARKNGKSLLASAIANYMLQVDGGYGARIYNVAPKLDQAAIVYDNTWTMIQLDPDWKERRAAVQAARESHRAAEDDPKNVKHRQSDLFLPGTNSTMKKVAFSAKKSDGFNPSLVICDEVAAWEGDKGLKQYEVMKSGMGSRPEPIMLSCTTSGYINDSVYDELIARGTALLQGNSGEKRFLPFFYMIDDITKWDDIEELEKANPNLGVSVTKDYLLEEIEVARGSASRQSEFICKYACLKQNSSLAWLPAEVVENVCGEEIRLEDFNGCYCVAGIDLSQTTDLTAACAVIEKDGKLNVISHFWLPAAKIDEAVQRDGLPYYSYIDRGFMSPSGDNFVDYHDCYNWMVNLVQEYEILPLKVGYDRYSAQYLIQDLDAFGFHTDDVFQGDNLWPIMQELEGVMKDGGINFGDNQIMKVHLLNAAVKMNVERGRGRLVKLSPNAHIDGVAALLDALTVRAKYYSEINEQLKN